MTFNIPSYLKNLKPNERIVMWNASDAATYLIKIQGKVNGGKLTIGSIKGLTLVTNPGCLKIYDIGVLELNGKRYKVPTRLIQK